MLLFPMPPLKFRTVGFPQYGFKPEYFSRSLPFNDLGLNAIPISTHPPKVCYSLRLITPARGPSGATVSPLPSRFPQTIQTQRPFA